MVSESSNMMGDIVPGKLGKLYKVMGKHPGKTGLALSAIAAAPIAAGMAMKPKTKEQMHQQNKRGISNLLIPYAGPVRLGRRIRAAISGTKD
jgi:hypothetical protein